MKSAVFALLLVVAGAFAFPQSDNPRPSVEDRIRNAIENISRRMQEAGYDPFEIENAKVEQVIVPNVIEAAASLVNLQVVGASVVDINNLEYIPFINRLIFDLSFPELKVSVDNAGVDVILFQHTLDAQLSGSLAIRGIRISGEINLNISVSEGVSVRSLTIDYFAGLVESKLNLDVNGRDFSEQVNNLFGHIIPAIMDDRRNEINRVLEFIMRILIDNRFN